jgi:hypothetical protein
MALWALREAVSYYSNSARQKDIPRGGQLCIHLDTYGLPAKHAELQSGRHLPRQQREQWQKSIGART